MSFHCTRSENRQLMYYINGKRVKKDYFMSQYPDFQDSECLTKSERKEQLSKIKKDINGSLTDCLKKLKECETKYESMHNEFKKASDEFVSNLLLDHENELDNKDALIEQMKEQLEMVQEEREEILEKVKELEKEQERYNKEHEDILNQSQERELEKEGLLKQLNDYQLKYDNLIISFEALTESKDDKEKTELLLELTHYKDVFAPQFLNKLRSVLNMNMDESPYLYQEIIKELEKLKQKCEDEKRNVIDLQTHLNQRLDEEKAKYEKKIEELEKSDIDKRAHLTQTLVDERKKYETHYTELVMGFAKETQRYKNAQSDLIKEHEEKLQEMKDKYNDVSVKNQDLSVENQDLSVENQDLTNALDKMSDTLDTLKE